MHVNNYLVKAISFLGKGTWSLPFSCLYLVGFDIICKHLLQLVAEVSMYVLQWLVSIILNFDNLFLHRVEYDLRNKQA